MVFIMKKTIAAFIMAFLAFPSLALAWPGKIVAVESADTFIVLKDGSTPVKIKLAGVKPSSDITSDKSLLDSSNIALMKDVDVRELSKSGETIIAEVTLDGKSLTNQLLDSGVVQSIASMAEQETPASVQESNTPLQNDQPETSAMPQGEASSDEIIAELESPAPEQQIGTDKTPVLSKNSGAATKDMSPSTTPPPNAPAVRYVQVAQQSDGLGLWPSRPKVTAVPVVSEQASMTSQMAASVPSSIMPSEETKPPKKQAPGDIAKKDYELAVKVQKDARRRKTSGFFLPKNKSETFAGAGLGAQLKTTSSSTEPYSTFGAMGGATVRHFYPSGWGIGGDFTYSSTSGKTGTSSNSTYDYKNKSFNTYIFTGSLLYRFYTDPHWTPYAALHGGYSFFSYPDTIFNISNGAPVAGGGAGIMYEFDSGFTIGTDMRYLKTFGTKSHDPEGFFDTTINFGYTFD